MLELIRTLRERVRTNELGRKRLLIARRVPDGVNEPLEELVDFLLVVLDHKRWDKQVRMLDFRANPIETVSGGH